MSEQAKKYCIILTDNLGLLLCRALRLDRKENSILGYYFKNRNDELCVLPLATTYYENGDYIVMESRVPGGVITVDSIKEDIKQWIEVKNAALDKIYADKLLDIEIQHIFSQKKGAILFMEQMGFPSECIEEYVNDGTVYFYDGFFREKITDKNHVELQTIMRHFEGKIYAVVRDHFLNRYCCLSWDPDTQGKRSIPQTKDERFGKISLVGCHLVDKKVEYIDIGIMTTEGGVWSIPEEIASMKEYRHKFCKFDE